MRKQFLFPSLFKKKGMEFCCPSSVYLHLTSLAISAYLQIHNNESNKYAHEHVQYELNG